MYCPGLLEYIHWSDRRLGMLAGVHRAPPELWPRLGGEEVRGPTSLAVPVEGTGTASVAPEKAPPVPVPGVQKPPRRVGKRFRDRLVAAPGKKV